MSEEVKQTKIKVYYDHATCYFLLLCDDGTGLPLMSKLAWHVLTKEEREHYLDEKWEMVPPP